MTPRFLPILLACFLASALPMRAAEPIDALYAALSEAEGGETIALPGGDYGTFFLAKKSKFNINWPSTVTITSADPADPAVFSGLDLRDVGSLTLDGVIFDYTWRKGGKLSDRPFRVSGGHDITIRNSKFDGDLISGVSAKEDGLATAVALQVRGTDKATVENNLIERFFRGVVMGGGTGNVVAGNELRDIRMDGLNFSQVQDIAIERNYLHGFVRSTNVKEHSDMIQFWTNNTTQPSTGIVIRDNVLMAGDGSKTQSIFMRNDLVDRGKAGREMFYRDILIEGNVIVNGHLHGISVGETDGLVIRNNTILRGEGFAEGNNRDSKVTIPRINVNEGSVNVTVTGNIAGAIPSPRDGWIVQDNLVVQNVTPSRPGYYHKVFADAVLGDPRVLDSYASRPGGPADVAGLGAPLLKPGADRSRYRPRRRRGPGRAVRWR